jgi:hypothetical protein
VGVQETLTEVMVGEAGVVLPPPQPAIYNKPRKERANKALHFIHVSFRSDFPGEI